jgi:two-component system chemotaxis response regulator CheY
MSDLVISDLLILLVEPSSTQRKYISTYLNDMGIDSVDFADSAESALAAMEQVVPDLVISSMHLPDMTGTDLLLRMREMGELAHVPFMLISSETHHRYLEPIRQAGAIAILPKPFELDQLRNALHSALDYIDPELLEGAEMSPEEIIVLLVDDSQLARKHIIRVLNNLGIEHIAEASNGLEAVELLKEQAFDLIVTDYNMPEMDGKEFSQYVRDESNQAGVPILMVTSESDESRLALVENVGVSAICDKPFEVSNVRDLLLKLLS